jgi:hypothetical protein
MLPETFQFPSVDFTTAWKLWWLGNPAKNIIPFRHIQPVDLSTKQQKRVLTEWRYLLTKFQRFVELKMQSNLKKDPNDEEVAMWFGIGKGLLDQIHGNGKRRVAQLKIGTVAKLFREIEDGKRSRPFMKRKRT